MRNFINIITESSDEGLSTVLKRLKDHPATKPMFRRGFSHYGWGDDYNSIDHTEAAKAFRDIVLHNHNAVKFIKDHNVNVPRNLSRFDVKDLGNEEMSGLFFHSILDFTQKATRYLNQMKKGEGKITGEIRKALAKWVDTNGHNHILGDYYRKALMAIPFIRPDKPVVLYRGILLSRETEKNTQWFDAIRNGERDFDHEWDRESSWTTDRKTAERFAKYASAQNDYQAMFSALNRKNDLDGELGILISTLARPEDIVVDLNKVDLGELQHQGESEMILAPGSYHVRIVNAWESEK